MNEIITGIIYMYTSPSGKQYIGQTIDEERRKWSFYNPNSVYGGQAIDNAREKYKPENFTYTVLYKNTFNNKNEAKDVLNELEIQLIEEYGSFTDGYNLNIGGGSGAGYKHSEEQIKAISESTTEQWQDPEFMQFMIESNKGILNPNAKPIAVYNLYGDFIDILPTVKEASIKYNITTSSIHNLLNKPESTPKRYSFIQTDKEVYLEILKTKVIPNFLKFDSELRNIRLVAQLDYNTKEIIAVFDSETQAADSTDTYKGSINKVLNKTRDKANGFSWKRINRLEYYKWKNNKEYEI